MFEYLKRLAARLRAGPGWMPPQLPDDPDAGVREPRRGGPTGGRSAVALREPEQSPPATAVGPNAPERRSSDERSAARP